MKHLLLVTLLSFTSNVCAKAKASDEAIEKQKKLCAALGAKYDKRKNVCKDKDKKRNFSKDKKKCLKAKGEWKYDGNEGNATNGRCEAAKSKAQIKCEKKKGTYDVATKKCDKAPSKRELKKLERKCRKEGYIYDVKNRKCSEEMTDKRKKCDSSQGTWSKGRCKKSKSAIKEMKKKCKLEGWKYLKDGNKCSDKKKSRARFKCEIRYKFENNEKVVAKWESGKCSVSRKEMKASIKTMKAFCKSQNLRFDRHLFTCPDFTGKIDLEKVELTRDQRKNSKKLAKEKKEQCYKDGLEYNKTTGECGEEKHKKAKKCIERGGDWIDAGCEGAQSKKEFRKAKRAEKRGIAQEAKKARKDKFKEAKITFKECKANPNKTRKECQQWYKFERRYIKAKFKDSILNGAEFKQCVKKALSLEEKEAEEGEEEIPQAIKDKVIRVAINMCFKQRNARRAKKALVGTLFTATYALAPGVGPAALAIAGVVLDGQIQKAKRKWAGKLQKIQDDIIKYIKEEGVYEAQRISQPMIETVLAEARKEYYQKMGFTEEEIRSSDMKLSARETKRLKKFENRVLKDWVKKSKKEAKQNYRKCIRDGVLTKDQCKFARKVTVAYIKSKSKSVKSSVLKACLDEAGEDKGKVFKCYQESRQRNLKAGGLLVMTEAGLLILHPGKKFDEYLEDRVAKHKAKFSTSAAQKTLEAYLEPVKKEFIKDLHEDALETYEQVLPQEKVDEALGLLDKRATLLVEGVGLDDKFDPSIASGVGSKEADAQKTFDEMKKEAIYAADENFKVCKQSSVTNYECRQLHKMEMRYIKSKFNAGLLRGNKFATCLSEKEEEFKDKLGSPEHVIAVNECFIDRNSRKAKRLAIAGAVVAVVITGAAIGYRVNKAVVDEFTKGFIKDNMKSIISDQGYKFEDGETYQKEDIDKYALGIADAQLQKFIDGHIKELEKAVVKGQSANSLLAMGAIPEGEDEKKTHFKKLVGHLHMTVVGTAMAFASMHGGSLKHPIKEELKKEAEAAYLKSIGKVAGEYLTRAEKRELKGIQKQIIEDLKTKFEKKMEAEFQTCSQKFSQSKCRKGKNEYNKVIRAIFSNKTFAGANFKKCIKEALKDLKDEVTTKMINETNKCYRARTKKRAVMVTTAVLFAGGLVATKTLPDGAVTSWMKVNIYDDFEQKYVKNIKQYINSSPEYLKKSIQKYFEGYREEVVMDYWNEAADNGMDISRQLAGIDALEKQWDQEVKKLELEVVKAQEDAKK